MLEDLIYTSLCNIPGLAGKLAVYKELPAIFHDFAPDDSDTNWGTEKFPQIVYFINSKYNPERNSNGLLLINVLCSEDGTVRSDDLSNLIVSNLSGLFYTEDSVTTCSMWNRTDSFKQLYMGSFDQPYTSITSGTQTAKTVCKTDTFNLFEFPLQISTNPDPIIGLNKWTKEEFPQCIVIGQDELSGTWKVNDAAPAIYWRTKGTISEMKATYSVAWIKATIVCHIIAGSPAQCHKWISEIVNCLSIEGEIALSDKSPMLISNISYSANGNPIKDGQITVSVTYGILRRDYAGVKLHNIGKEGEI